MGLVEELVAIVNIYQVGMGKNPFYIKKL